jgi:phosphoribosylformylglycinamidine synthase
MKFLAEVNVMPLKEILDPQGKAVRLGLQNLGISGVEEVRIGKHITLEIEADSAAQAEEQVEKACRRLLANLIMESYSFQLHSLAPAE